MRTAALVVLVVAAVVFALAWWRRPALRRSPVTLRVGAVLVLLAVAIASPLPVWGDDRDADVAPRNPPPAQPRDSAPARGDGAAVRLSDLPREARETVALIDRGGPFPYARDGVVFGNREGLLPRRPRGFYREYTVPTPGSRDRGARRVVAGDGARVLFYSDDHYASFRAVTR